MTDHAATPWIGPISGDSAGDLIRRELQQPGLPDRFTDEAASRLVVEGERLVGLIGVRSVAITRAKQRQHVEVSDVDEAVAGLIDTAPSEQRAWLLAVGSLLTGGAITVAVGLLTPGFGISLWGWLPVGLLALLGLVFVMMGKPPKRKSRQQRV